MSKARVKRSLGPKGTITKNNYRRKALPWLLKDFQHRCAYCLKLLDTTHPNQTHVDHFNAHAPRKLRNRYKNFMLACSACNLSKHFKPIQNRFDPSQHLLNCTELNEFPEHIIEHPSGEWIAKTPAAKYHITSIDLNESSHVATRRERRRLAHHVEQLRKHAVFYEGSMDSGALREMLDTMTTIERQLLTSIPLIDENGVRSFASIHISTDSPSASASEHGIATPFTKTTRS